MHAGAGMYDHAGGLVDGDDVRVLVKDGERNLLGNGMERGGFGGLDVDLVTGPHQV